MKPIKVVKVSVLMQVGICVDSLRQFVYVDVHDFLHIL